MTRVFWDTNLFIYLFETTGNRYRNTVDLLNRMNYRQDQLVTSAMTLGEVMTGPILNGDPVLAGRYENLIRSQATVVAFDADCAKLFAQIRMDRSITPPDAIQLACAAHASTEFFVTNDGRLSRKQISGITTIASLDHVPI